MWQRVSPVPVRMWQVVQGESPVPVQMWQRLSSVAVQMWQRVSPVAVQMWQRVSPVPVQMWQVYAVPFRYSGRRQRRRSSAPRCNQTQAQRNLAGWWALAGVGRAVQA